MLIVAGFALVYPSGIADAIGLALVVAVLAMQRLLPRRRWRWPRIAERTAPSAVVAPRLARGRRR